MSVKITYFVEITSSWCHWAEPAWAELKRRYEGKPVEFQWRIALLDAEGLCKSRKQANWFYRRSGTITGSPVMLKSSWLEPGLKEYLAPNLMAEAAKDFGVTDDRVRLALAEAAMLKGKRVGQWGVSAAIAAEAADLDLDTLLARAQSPEIEKRARRSSTEFHDLQITQRPAFLLESGIGDRAVFSGIWRVEPLIAAIDSMLADAAAYASWQAHMGEPPEE